MSDYKQEIKKNEIDRKNFIIPENIILKWQDIVNFIAKFANVPVALIMKIDYPYIEVFRSSETDKNPYNVGDREHLTGLYCEHVIKTKNRLLVPNALKEELWKRNPDIKLGMLSYLGFPLLWPDGNAFGTICILDLKENPYGKDYDEIMLRFKDLIEAHLALLDENYNLKITQKKLNESEEKYREAYNQANFYKDIVVHDISNVLQNVYSSLELVKTYRGKPEEMTKLNELIEIMEHSTKRGTKLITNVRKLSRLEEVESSLQSIDVLPVLNEAINFLKKNFQDKEIIVQVDAPKKMQHVKANEFLLDVFENLLNNSSKYNENSIVYITVKIFEEKRDGVNLVRLEFQDNGTGIPDAKKEAIFQKGLKRYTNIKGMGIGLSLVKKIIDGYSGQIWIEDKVEGDYTKGSNFVILLPEIN